MKNKPAFLLSLVAAGAAFAIVYIIRKRNEKKMLASISEEGYETATDILFPGKKLHNSLQYGPVIPQ